MKSCNISCCHEAAAAFRRVQNDWKDAAAQKDASSISSKRALLAAAAPGFGKARHRTAEGESGMVLPFEPLNMTFHHVDYFVDLPLVRLCAGRAQMMYTCHSSSSDMYKVLGQAHQARLTLHNNSIKATR